MGEDVYELIKIFMFPNLKGAPSFDLLYTE